ncbi:MAG TPA: potassium-transporting ATPase subunit C [Bryobacteraceae bacterium]|jgi:K+-transporting ATPase KdpC subunit|nr:potassium-transporting ATPase subunit C [Bryobacteraceae bacterium]
MSDRDEPGEEASECAPLLASTAKLGDQIRPAILSVLVLTLLTGCAFPLLLAAIGRALFPHEAGGSLLTHEGVVIGSELIGQEFSRPEYFQSRPSAAGDGYDGTSSGGTNLGPNNPKLKNGGGGFAGVAQLAQEYRKLNGLARRVASHPLLLSVVCVLGRTAIRSRAANNSRADRCRDHNTDREAGRANGDVDLIVTDIRLPGHMDGLDPAYDWAVLLRPT